MPIKYIPYKIEPLRGQAVLPFLRYHRQLTAKDFQLQGVPYFEVELSEKVNQSSKKLCDNLLIHGECLNACAYLKEEGIMVDLVYIDPPFASGANYAKKIYIRQNPKLVAKLEEAQGKLQSQPGEEVDNKDLQTLEETMYGDIWQKEDYLNWLYERLLAIKEVMSDTASIYVHLDWHIGHYVKILMDEVFGEESLINEIIWAYRIQGVGKGTFARKHDTIFAYRKSDKYTFNPEKEKVIYENPFIDTKKDSPDISRLSEGDIQKINECLSNKEPLPDKYKKKLFNTYYSEVYVRDVWDGDYTKPIISGSSEYVGYITQKPEGLLKRIINASSNDEMVRKFITADVGINAIQTIRDRLVEAKSSFDILKIKDGIDLFRNPQQTMDKLASIIPSLSTSHNFGSFWFGAITDRGMVCPCWVPDLKDKQQAILNPALFSKIMDETAKLDGISKVVVCSVDITGQAEIDKMRKDYDLRDVDGKPVQFIFKDLKELIDLIVSPDVVEYSVQEKGGKHTITFDRFISDALIQKIAEFNAKKQANQKQIEISDAGLELIEFISIDCTNTNGVWVSDHEIKIDKNGYLIVNGEQTKQFWNGAVSVSKKPLRIKVRNIAGDELVVVAE